MLVPGFLLPFLFLSISALAKDEPCTTRQGSRLYDLRPLKTSKDYVFKSPSGLEFSLNVCRALSNDTWNVAPPEPSQIAGRVRRPHGDFALGAVNETFEVRAGAPVMTLTGGSACPKNDKAQTATVVRFVCDRGFTSGEPMEGSGKGRPQLLAQVPLDDDSACTFFVEWRTQYACAVDESYGFWGILGITILVILGLLVAYIALGVLYRRFVLHHRGAAQFPPLTLSHLGEMISFVRDALDDVWSRRADPFDRYGAAWSGWNINAPGLGGGARGSGRGGGGYGYEQVPAHRDEMEAMIGSDDESEVSDDIESARPQVTLAATTPAAATPAAATPAAPVPSGGPPSRQQGMDGQGTIRL